MDSTNGNIKNLTKIPEKEFKQHFRDWMEQDDVARSLQAKLRKDLIANFNKTSLGKKIIVQTGACHRLSLSPLLLALNTLAAEFLYAQNCHFTLSVFCTEVPYRNTLPDFESAHHFRFSEREIFEVLDALASNYFDMDTKQSICKEYSKSNNPSLLFVIIKNLLRKPKENKRPDVEVASSEKHQMRSSQDQQQNMFQKSGTFTSDKINSKLECQSNNFLYLNKYLMILSKKMKEMSGSLEVLQKQPQTFRKSLQARKFENLNRNLEKISTNLKNLSVSKKKNKRLSNLVTAVDTMAKQFEKCLFNFEKLSQQSAEGEAAAGRQKSQKSYSDWIHEMRTTENGKLFIDKVEASLKKILHRERKKMETELAERVEIQKEFFKSKYKQRQAEELSGAGKSADECQQQANEAFEKKLSEFEARHKELHSKIEEAEKKITESSSNKSSPPELFKNKITQTSKIVAGQGGIDQKRLQEMVKNISERERQVNHIVFDAKLRVQELEHESNQLDRSFRDYLERQRSEKQKMRENATSIWESYALGKSMLSTKTTTHQHRHQNHHCLNTITKVDKQPVPIFDRTTATDLTIPTISIDDDSPRRISPPAFENPFRVAKKKVLSRSKSTFPNQPSPTPSIPELPLADTDTDSDAQNSCTQDKSKQQPTPLRLIGHKHQDNIRRPKMSPTMSTRTKATSQSEFNQITTQLLSPELNIDDITLDGIEISPTTAKSSSVPSGSRSRSVDSSSSARGVFKLKRQLFATNTRNGGGTPTSTTKSNGHGRLQMNDNDDNKNSQESLGQINKHQTGQDDIIKKKSIEQGHSNKNDTAIVMNEEIIKTNKKDLETKANENKTSQVSYLGTSTGVGLDLDDPLKITTTEKVDGGTSESFHLTIPITDPMDQEEDTPQRHRHRHSASSSSEEG